MIAKKEPPSFRWGQMWAGMPGATRERNLSLLWIEVTVALIHDESIACSKNSFKELLK